tara:strand:- start:71 stop:1000 length:930 start_codon:yes stop_codon:yes gene_type:complete
MKNENLKPIIVETKKDNQKFGGHWFRGANCNFIPSKKHFEDNDFYQKYILKGFLPKKPFIEKNHNILAFGSCFATAVSDYLSYKKYSVFNKQYSTNSHIIRYGEGMANTFTVVEQLLWGFENKNIEENTWYHSPNDSARNDQATREETLVLLKKIDIFIITVGLSEVWYNKSNNQVFWKAIPIDKFDENNHGFRLSTVDENTNNLIKIYSTIKKHLPNAKVIFTLSPIPLMATFRPQSCITANSVSKSILRVAIDNMLTKFKNENELFYFPSYEITKDYFVDPFKEDNRHLKDDYTSRIMEVFEKFYCK